MPEEGDPSGARLGGPGGAGGHVVRLRRASCLVAHFEEDEFVVENYLTGRQTSLSPIIAEVLCRLSEFSTRAVVKKTFASLFPGGAEVVERLMEQDVLLVEGSGLESKDRAVDERWKWGHDARYFHFSTQVVLYETEPEIQRNMIRNLARSSPPPSAFKRYDLPAVKLPGRYDEYDQGLWRALAERRTKRDFLRLPMSLDQLGCLLLWTWGATKRISDPELGEFVLKTSPSGGALHPMQVYPIILRVDGIPPGIYHYSVERHALHCLREGTFEDLAVSLCSGHRWVGDAAAIFFMTAMVERTMWKYPHSHAYRVLLLDAGHVGQTFHLVATALGLAPFTLAATDDRAIEHALNLDPISEIPLYAAAAGRPAHPEAEGTSMVDVKTL